MQRQTKRTVKNLQLALLFMNTIPTQNIPSLLKLFQSFHLFTSGNDALKYVYDVYDLQFLTIRQGVHKLFACSWQCSAKYSIFLLK